MKYVAKIQRSKIQKLQIYINTGRRSLAQIQAETGADYVLNGGVFDSRFRACCHLRADGYTWAEDEYLYYGYGWDTNDPRVMLSGEKDTVRNYICCVELIRDGKPVDKPIYNADLGGARGRSAMGLMPNGDLVLWCSEDGTADAMTPEGLRDALAELGIQSAIMLDGGGSSQCDFAGAQIASSRVVQNLICVYLKKGDKTKTDKHIVCLDPGHGGTDSANGSPDGTYKEHEFTLDMGKRIKAHLERCGVAVVMTRETDTGVGLSRRAEIANAAGAELYVSLHSNAGGSGWNDTVNGLTVWTYAAGGERNRAANILLDEMKSAGVQTFGTKLYHSNFTVLAKTVMPAYLVEYAFHTSHSDVKLLLDTQHRDKLATATAKAICIWGGVKWIDAPTAPTKPVDGTIYRVQVGAFAHEQNAAQLKQELEGKGYKPYIVKEVKA